MAGSWCGQDFPALRMTPVAQQAHEMLQQPCLQGPSWCQSLAKVADQHDLCAPGPLSDLCEAQSAVNDWSAHAVALADDPYLIECQFHQSYMQQ